MFFNHLKCKKHSQLGRPYGKRRMAVIGWHLIYGNGQEAKAKGTLPFQNSPVPKGPTTWEELAKGLLPATNGKTRVPTAMRKHRECFRKTKVRLPWASLKHLAAFHLHRLYLCWNPRELPSLLIQRHNQAPSLARREPELQFIWMKNHIWCWSWEQRGETRGDCGRHVGKAVTVKSYPASCHKTPGPPLGKN